MFLTLVNLATKAKADRIVVLCKSIASGHGRMQIRPRLGEKVEFVDFDPWIQRVVLYKEDKKVRSVRTHQIQTIPRLLYTNDVHSRDLSLRRKIRGETKAPSRQKKE